MFAHPNPENIVIVGGGEGAITHEILKHKTVRKVTKIELDPMLIELTRQYLPAFSDCSDLEGRAENCFDDELLTILYEDGIEWFVDRYGPNATKERVDPIDVIVVDVLYPEDSTTRSDKVYQDANFWSSLMKSLSDEGVLSVVVGTCPNIYDPKPQASRSSLQDFRKPPRSCRHVCLRRSSLGIRGAALVLNSLQECQLSQSLVRRE
jgi:spermidine synthase